MTDIHFEKATLSHQEIIFEWLDKPHVREFWDNSAKHREGILSFMNGRVDPTLHFGGMTYWVGSVKGNPYCFILTHEEIDAPDVYVPEAYRPHLSKTGKTFGLDFCIGNEHYLSKGLAAPTLESFTKFFVEQVNPETDTFLIDPFINNPRAIHVYEKAGFKIVSEFTQEGGYFDQSKGVLMVKIVSPRDNYESI